LQNYFPDETSERINPSKFGHQDFSEE